MKYSTSISFFFEILFAIICEICDLNICRLYKDLLCEKLLYLSMVFLIALYKTQLELNGG